MYFVSRKTTMLLLLSSSILAIAGCGGQKSNDQNSSMMAAQGKAIVANEAHASMSDAIKNITLVKVPSSGVTPTMPTSSNSVNSPSSS